MAMRTGNEKTHVILASESLNPGKSNSQNKSISIQDKKGPANREKTRKPASTRRKITKPDPQEEPTIPEETSKEVKKVLVRKNRNVTQKVKINLNDDTKKTAKKLEMTDGRVSNQQGKLFLDEPITNERVKNIVAQNSLSQNNRLASDGTSSLVQPKDLKDFATYIADTFDGAVSAAIDFIESSGDFTLINNPGMYERLTKFYQLKHFPENKVSDEFKRINKDQVKKKIKKIFDELVENKNEIEPIINTKEKDNSEYLNESLNLYCLVFKLALKWCCEIILIDRSANQNFSSSETSLTNIFYNKIIASLGRKLNVWPIAPDLVCNLIETDCLILVKGIIDFSNDMEAISSYLQLRSAEHQSVEFIIYRFSKQKISDWNSNFDAIVAYENSLSKKIIDIEILLNRNELTALLSDQLSDTDGIINDPGHQSDRNVGLEINNDEVNKRELVYSDDIGQQRSNDGMLIGHEIAEKNAREEENGHSQATIDTTLSAVSNSLIEARKKLPYIDYRLIIVSFVIIIAVGLGSKLHFVDRANVFYKNLRSAEFNEEKNEIFVYSDQGIYSKPEIGKLLVLYKSYFPSEYEKSLRNIISSKTNQDEFKAKNDTAFMIINTIADKRKFAVAKMQLPDMDQILQDEIKLVQRLINSSSVTCHSLLPHTDRLLITSSDINKYLDDVVSVSMSELDATQNAIDKAENRQFLSEKDFIEIQNLFVIRQASNLNFSQIKSYLNDIKRDNSMGCQNTLSILEFILGSPERLRLKLEQQVLSQ